MSGLDLLLLLESRLLQQLQVILCLLVYRVVVCHG